MTARIAPAPHPSPLRRAATWLAALATVWVPISAQAEPAEPLSLVKRVGPTNSAPPVHPAIRDRKPWHYANSDIPVDAAWHFGTLRNGLRYAVRKGGVPPGQAAIRVRINAGSFAEADDERGYAHLLEHLAFRGSKLSPNGEAKRFWQTLGVSFGSDTNAATTNTQTVYQLDVPATSPTDLSRSVAYVASMVRDPLIDDSAVLAERNIVLAEQRESDGPQMRVAEATMNALYAGQRLAVRHPIGTPETLGKATAERVKAFHQRWYRPDQTLVVVVGDVPVAQLENLVAEHFGSWENTGRWPGLPAPGDPNPRLPAAAVITEPGQPLQVVHATLRPYRFKQDTRAFTRQLYLNFIAMQILDNRLERKARDGGHFLRAGVEQEVASRSADYTAVSIFPVGKDWDKALLEVRAIIDDARARPPSQAEVDRVLRALDSAIERQIATALNAPDAELADEFVKVVDIQQVSSSPTGDRELLQAVRKAATPARILATTRALFTGSVTRTIVITPGDPAVTTRAVAAAAKRRVATDASARRSDTGVTFADLPAIGTPGTIEREERMAGLNTLRVDLSNGVRALVLDNKIEPDKVRVVVRWGNGYSGIPGTEETPVWAGPSTFVSSGIGRFGVTDLEEMANGRAVGLRFDITEDAFRVSAETKPSDLADQMKLIAAKLAHPGWDPAPIERLKAEAAMLLPSRDASPATILQLRLEALLRGNDPRWMPPSAEAIAALTPDSYRAFWAPRLAQGPVEVHVYGDLSSVDWRKILRETVGALPVRNPARPNPNADVRAIRPTATPMQIMHEGNGDQAAAVMAWATGGGTERLTDARGLEVMAEVFNNRLFERMRNESGTSYSPIAQANWPVGVDRGGYVMVMSMVEPDRIPMFEKTARAIADELVKTPVSAAELARAVSPLKERVTRATSGNAFWMTQIEGVTQDPRRLLALRSLVSGYDAVTPATVQYVAQRYLSANKAWVLHIVPRPGAAKSAAASQR